MYRAFIAAAAALILIGAQSASAADSPRGTAAHSPKSQSSKSGKHAAPQARKPKVYGTPIQPPIVQKRASKKTSKPVSAANAAAKKKANAAAARKAQADLEYRRQNPASANGPR